MKIKVLLLLIFLGKLSLLKPMEGLEEEISAVKELIKIKKEKLYFCISNSLEKKAQVYSDQLVMFIIELDTLLNLKKSQKENAQAYTRSLKHRKSFSY